MKTQTNQTTNSQFIRWPIIIVTFISMFFILWEDLFIFSLYEGLFVGGVYKYLVFHDTLNCFLFLNLIAFIFGLVFIVSGKIYGYQIIHVSSFINLFYIFLTAVVYIKSYWGKPFDMIYSHTFWNISIVIFSLLCYRVTSFMPKAQMILNDND